MSNGQVHTLAAPGSLVAAIKKSRHFSTPADKLRDILPQEQQKRCKRHLTLKRNIPKNDFHEFLTTYIDEPQMPYNIPREGRVASGLRKLRKLPE